MILLVSLLIAAIGQSQISFLPNDTYTGFQKETISFDYQSINQSLSSQNLGKLTLNIFSQKNELILKPVSIMTPELALMYPNIKTYKAYTKDGKVNGRITIDTYGIYAQLYTDSGFISMYPDDYKMSGKHTVELGRDPSVRIPACQVKDHKEHQLSDISDSYQYKINELSNGNNRNIYKMAIVTTYEFYRRTGSSESSTTAAVVAAVNALEEVYENELAVNFKLLPPKVFTDIDDPFDPEDSRPDQANDAVMEYFDFDDFDIGHVLNASGGGWPGGGVTNRSILCHGNETNSRKGAGWSGSYSRLDFDFIKTFAHEIGHMFGAPHSWNGAGGSCNAEGQHPGFSAYEIGSGSTIMSYNGLCGNQNTPSPIDHFFHTSSIFWMITHMEASKSNCSQLIKFSTNNSPPQVNADNCGVTNIKIPHSTPFFIQGQATDDDGLDDLSYSWEQYDSGGQTAQGLIGDEASQSKTAPLFLTLNPSQSPIRYFPEIRYTFNDRKDKFQALPEVARDMNFKFIARDNNTSAGGIGIDGVTIETSEYGPFEITSLNSKRFNLGDRITIEWDTNGTAGDNVCENLAVLISYNDGVSFDFSLAEDIPYGDGEASFIIPEGVPNTTTGMLMLACDDNSCIRFYDLHNERITFGTSCASKPSSFCDVTPIVAAQGSEELALELDVIISNQLITSNSTQCGPPGGLNSTTAYTYIAVGQDDNIVRATSSNGDFRFLLAGQYYLYGLTYKSGEPQPPAIVDPVTWIGQNLDEVINADICAQKSINSVPLEISGGEDQPCGFSYDIGPTDPGFRPKRCLAPFSYDENIRDSEALVANDLILGRKYSFTFCEGYDEDIFEARVVIQEYNSETEELGDVLSDEIGCQHDVRLNEFSSFDDVLIIISDNNDCQRTSKNLENGKPRFRCAFGRDLVEGESDPFDNLHHDYASPRLTPSVSIFPNPAQDELNVAVENLETYNVVITDLTGSIISKGENRTRIDISNLSNGLYLIHIQDEKSSFNTVEKFVVLK